MPYQIAKYLSFIHVLFLVPPPPPSKHTLNNCDDSSFRSVGVLFLFLYFTFICRHAFVTKTRTQLKFINVINPHSNSINYFSNYTRLEVTAIMMIARQLCIIYLLYMCILIMTWAKGVRVSRRHLHIFSFNCLVLL